MKVAAIQSNYLPWKGYFDIINAVDLFIFYDEVQYTSKSWRNRNRIKTPHGTKWLTVPCSSSRHQLISEVRIPDPHWQRKHWKSLEYNYGKTPYFDEYKVIFEEIYTGRIWDKISPLNQHLIQTISKDILGSNTRFADSRSYNLKRGKEKRVLDMLVQCGATSFLSGPTARSYLHPDHFADKGIELIWMDYNGYPEYHQMYPPFEHRVSIIDLIFHTGPHAGSYMLTFHQSQTP